MNCSRNNFTYKEYTSYYKEYTSYYKEYTSYIIKNILHIILYNMSDEHKIKWRTNLSYGQRKDILKKYFEGHILIDKIACDYKISEITVKRIIENRNEIEKQKDLQKKKSINSQYNKLDTELHDFKNRKTWVK